MTTQTELLREALELADAYANAFNNYGSSLYNPTTAAARKALADKMAALAQPEQPAPQGLTREQQEDQRFFDRLASPTPPQAEQAEAAKTETELRGKIHGHDAKATFPAWPEPERAWLLGTLRGIATIIQMGEPERLKVNDYEPILQAAALLSADSKDAESVPADCDVRKIMLDVVPGWDGTGQEVYAKSVREVEDLLSDMGQRLEDFELGITSPQAADAQPLTEGRIHDLARSLRWAIHVGGLGKDAVELVRAAERAHGITGKGNAS